MCEACLETRGSSGRSTRAWATPRHLSTICSVASRRVPAGPWNVTTAWTGDLALAESLRKVAMAGHETDRRLDGSSALLTIHAINSKQLRATFHQHDTTTTST